jgi:hypothetical protein
VKFQFADERGEEMKVIKSINLGPNMIAAEFCNFTIDEDPGQSHFVVFDPSTNTIKTFDWEGGS